MVVFYWLKKPSVYSPIAELHYEYYNDPKKPDAKFEKQ
jgi:hypothetical protein